MRDVKTRKVFLKGKLPYGSQCASSQSSVFYPRGSIQEPTVPKKEMVTRLHCLRYGKYFVLKDKCLKCRHLISFTQRVA